MFVLASFIGITVLLAIWGGIVLKMLWGWFMVPTFGLPDLGLAVAIGVILLVSLPTEQYIPMEEDDLPRLIFHGFLHPTVALAMGFAVHLFI